MFSVTLIPVIRSLGCSLRRADARNPIMPQRHKGTKKTGNCSGYQVHGSTVQRFNGSTVQRLEFKDKKQTIFKQTIE
jgi:hypothetical protein